MISALPEHPGTVAVVIGQAKSEYRGFLDTLKSRVASAGLTERIIFRGEVPATELPGLLGAMDMLVALPRYEGYGMTPLEAMAAGVPIVASDTGHFGAFLGVDAGHFIIPDGDPHAAAIVIGRLLSDAAAKNAYATRLRQRAITKFGVHTEADAIQQVYERLWAGERRCCDA